MSVMVDVAFVLVATVLFPSGDLAFAVESYQTRDECMSNRTTILETAKALVAKQKLRVFVGECTAIPVGEEITR